MESVLVTGANGFIGSHLSCELANRGFVVYGFSRSNKSKNPQFEELVSQGKIKMILGEIQSFDTAKLPKVDYIFHLAGKVSVWGKLNDFKKINLEGTKNLLNFAKETGVKCFTFLSSVAVYGFYGYKNLPEEGEKKPFKNPYSLTKLETETFVKDFAEQNKIDYVIVRPGNVYGEYDYTSSDEIYSRVKRGKMMTSAGGKYESCFVYAKNLVEAIIFTALKNEAHNTDYNVSDSNSTLKTYLQKVAKAYGVKPKFTNFPAPLAKATACLVEFVYKFFRIKKAPKITRFTVWQNCADYSFSTKKLENIGYKKIYNEDEAIKRTAKYFK